MAAEGGGGAAAVVCGVGGGRSYIKIYKIKIDIFSFSQTDFKAFSLLLITELSVVIIVRVLVVRMS